MKKLSKNFQQCTTVEAMANVCTDGCGVCSCATGTYCTCNTVSDYAGYQYYPERSNEKSALYTEKFNFLVQFDGIV